MTTYLALQDQYRRAALHARAMRRLYIDMGGDPLYIDRFPKYADACALLRNLEDRIEEVEISIFIQEYSV